MLHAPACGVVVVEKPFVQGGTHTHTVYIYIYYIPLAGATSLQFLRFLEPCCSQASVPEICQALLMSFVMLCHGWSAWGLLWLFALMWMSAEMGFFDEVLMPQ